DQHIVTNKDSGRSFRIMDDTVVCFGSVSWTRVSLSQFYPPDRGHYRVRISASGFQSSGKPISFEVSGHSVGLIGYFDVPADKPTVTEFTARMEAWTGFSFLPYGLGSEVHKVGGENYKGPGMAVQWVEVEGPLSDAWPPSSHRRLFGELPQVRVKNN